MAKIYRSMTELVGGTPLLELTNYEPGGFGQGPHRQGDA